MCINLVLYKIIFIYLFKTASIMFLAHILFVLLEVEYSRPISHKIVKCKSLGLALAIVPPSTRGNFVHYNFQILHYIKVSKVAKIRNRYNQVPHLTQDTNGKVTNSQKTP